jgi:undecaprenyl-diphosphatase
MGWIPFILGVVEGLTEFLPVSSTGHLIVTGYVLGFTGDFAKTFEIVIQLGAISAVVVYFRTTLATLLRRWSDDPAVRSLVIGIGLAFLPAAMIGLLTHGMIKTYLFNPTTVALALIAGGIAILVIEGRHHTNRVTRLMEVDLRTALWVGMAQCLALFPGVSRSGATIMGGLLTGMNRQTAAEFSFFLAIPTMFAATLFDAFKNRSLLVEENLLSLAVGFTAAFITALVVIALFMTYIKRHTFRVFAYYRILFGLIVLGLFWR